MIFAYQRHQGFRPIVLFLNSEPRSGWKILMFSRLRFIEAKALITMGTYFLGLVLYPIISRLNRSINTHICNSFELFFNPNIDQITYYYIQFISFIELPIHNILYFCFIHGLSLGFKLFRDVFGYYTLSFHDSPYSALPYDQIIFCQFFFNLA